MYHFIHEHKHKDVPLADGQTIIRASRYEHHWLQSGEQQYLGCMGSQHSIVQMAKTARHHKHTCGYFSTDIPYASCSSNDNQYQSYSFTPYRVIFPQGFSDLVKTNQSFWMLSWRRFCYVARETRLRLIMRNSSGCFITRECENTRDSTCGTCDSHITEWDTRK